VRVVLGSRASFTTAKRLEYCFAQCRCRAGEETPRHITLSCTEEAERQQRLLPNGRVNYQELIVTNSGTKEASRVDDLLREAGLILAGKAPSLQLMDSSEATLIGITGCE
jgi:hypothetical protein